MPCGGPSQEYAYKVGDEYTDKVLADLKEKHGVQPPETNWAKLREDHDAARLKLREAIRELIWIEHCASW